MALGEALPPTDGRRRQRRRAFEVQAFLLSKGLGFRALGFRVLGGPCYLRLSKYSEKYLR